ncbi:type I secretion system permease/ATPase [Pseudotabrizicola formosa]|uniref:type I secretion system permease/ATPase n=1 Tax=Pseudotabrizicola formosa TaxID=2030009 RepID=UPI000CD07B13|nr:type I secretion system permease/ATPase [Pseudotabrizicola formosa]
MKVAPVSVDLAAGQFETARAELTRAARQTRGLLIAAVVFSVFVNLLMLTGPLYMLQVYDRVLGSRSEATLVALSLLVLLLFLAMGLLDHARGRLLARIGAWLQMRLDHRVFTAALARASLSPEDPLAASAQRDLEAMQRFWTSPLASAVMDLPWTPLFLLAIFLFHPMLGWLALAGGAVLVALALGNQVTGKGQVLQTAAALRVADQMADRLKADAEVLGALGMVRPAFQRWSAARGTALSSLVQSGDLTGRFGAATRALRMMLQSAILGLGAWLVLQDQLSAGAMIAASIIMGRALAPIEQAVAHWAVLTRARDGRARLLRLLAAHPPDTARTALPKPRAMLEVKGVSLILPGTPAPVLRDIGFRLDPGQALGIIGPSGAGKSTLGRAIVGGVQPFAGKIRLGGADLAQYDPDTLGRYIGYLPQSVTLFDASVAENIARLDPQPDAAKVVAAATAAAAHDMILRLPKGYDTPLSSIGAPLSGGQIQRIGLARALYDDPVLLVLDEPNSHLDNDGSVALNAAIRRVKASGGAVIVIAHRPAAIQECDILLVLEEGQCRAFGPRDDVLRGMVRNHTELVRGSMA